MKRTIIVTNIPNLFQGILPPQDLPHVPEGDVLLCTTRSGATSLARSLILKAQDPDLTVHVVLSPESLREQALSIREMLGSGHPGGAYVFDPDDGTLCGPQ